MNEIKCPNCGTVFQINVKDFGLFSLENYHDNPVAQQHIVDTKC